MSPWLTEYVLQKLQPPVDGNEEFNKFPSNHQLSVLNNTAASSPPRLIQIIGRSGDWWTNPTIVGRNSQQNNVWLTVSDGVHHVRALLSKAALQGILLQVGTTAQPHPQPPSFHNYTRGCCALIRNYSLQVVENDNSNNSSTTSSLYLKVESIECKPGFQLLTGSNRANNNTSHQSIQDNIHVRYALQAHLEKMRSKRQAQQAEAETNTNTTNAPNPNPAKRPRTTPLGDASLLQQNPDAYAAILALAETAEEVAEKEVEQQEQEKEQDTAGNNPNNFANDNSSSDDDDDDDLLPETQDPFQPETQPPILPLEDDEEQQTTLDTTSRMYIQNVLLTQDDDDDDDEEEEEDEQTGRPESQEPLLPKTTTTARRRFTSPREIMEQRERHKQEKRRREQRQQRQEQRRRTPPRERIQEQQRQQQQEAFQTPPPTRKVKPQQQQQEPLSTWDFVKQQLNDEECRVIVFQQEEEQQGRPFSPTTPGPKTGAYLRRYGLARWLQHNVVKKSNKK